MGPGRVDPGRPRHPAVEGPRVEDVSGPDAMDDATLVVLPSWPTDLPNTEQALARGIRAAQALGSRIAGLCLRRPGPLPASPRVAAADDDGCALA